LGVDRHPPRLPVLATTGEALRRFVRLFPVLAMAAVLPGTVLFGFGLWQADVYVDAYMRINMPAAWYLAFFGVTRPVLEVMLIVGLGAFACARLLRDDVRAHPLSAFRWRPEMLSFFWAYLRTWVLKLMAAVLLIFAPLVGVELGAGPIVIWALFGFILILFLYLLPRVALAMPAAAAGVPFSVRETWSFVRNNTWRAATVLTTVLLVTWLPYIVLVYVVWVVAFTSWSPGVGGGYDLFRSLPMAIGLRSSAANFPAFFVFNEVWRGMASVILDVFRRELLFFLVERILALVVIIAIIASTLSATYRRLQPDEKMLDAF